MGFTVQGNRKVSTGWWIQTQYLLCCEAAVLTTVPPQVSQPFKKLISAEPSARHEHFFPFLVWQQQFFFILTPSSLFSFYTETTHHSHLLVSTTSPGIALSVHPVPSQLTMMSISKVPLPFFPL